MKASTGILYTKVVIHPGVENVFHLHTHREVQIKREVGKPGRVHGLIGNNIGSINFGVSPQSQESIRFEVFGYAGEVVFAHEGEEPVSFDAVCIKEQMVG